MSPAGATRGAASYTVLDIGATKVEAAIVHEDGSLTNRQRLLLRDAGDDLFSSIVAMVRQVRASSQNEVLGVACAGPMSQGGELVSPLNIAQWRDFPLREKLRQNLQLDVFIDGDVRALALAEGHYGAARGISSYLSMVVSTGVGGAVVLDGRLLDGRTGNAGHLGHLVLVPEGRHCSCGARGCLEAEASGWAIQEMTGHSPEESSGDVRRHVAHLVGSAVGTLAAVLDLEYCFVGGSVALGFGEEFFSESTKRAREVGRMPYAANVTVAPTGLGADGVLLGAALVAKRGSS